MAEADQPQINTEELLLGLDDFVLNIYRGCVLPEDYKPVQTTTWFKWLVQNSEDYSPDQFDRVKQKLLAGKSWVTFSSRLETICAPDHYKPQPPYNNPVRPKDRQL